MQAPTSKVWFAAGAEFSTFSSTSFLICVGGPIVVVVVVIIDIGFVVVVVFVIVVAFFFIVVVVVVVVVGFEYVEKTMISPLSFVRPVGIIIGLRFRMAANCITLR